MASYFDGDIKEGTHKNIFLDRNTFETWRKKPISEERHLLVNGYANSWIVDTTLICAEKDADNADKDAENANGCVKNADGSYDMELVVEFWPQRLFYVGLAVSLITLISLIVALSLTTYAERRRKIPENADDKKQN